jgi:hypothetical protein
MTPTQLRTLQVKLSIVPREYLRLYPTTLWVAYGRSPDIAVFRPFYRGDEVAGYSADFQRRRSFATSIELLEAMIDSVGTIPEVVDGGVDSAGFISFAMARTAGDTVTVFESILNHRSGALLLAKLLPLFSTNTRATDLLIGPACTYGFLPGERPIDVSSLVAIEVGKFRRDPVAGRHIGIVRITNQGVQAIPGPLTLVMHAPAQVIGSKGVPCGTRYMGQNLELPGKGLPAGQHIDLVVRLENVEEEPVEITGLWLYSGPVFHMR